MKYFEHRRHSERNSEGSFLNQAGVNLARKVGSKMNQEGKSFAKVITSTKDRALQTPIAMGFAVNKSLPIFTTFGKEVDDELSLKNLTWDAPFSDLKPIMVEGSHILNYGKSQLVEYKKLLDTIEDGESLLLVTHGGCLEYPLLTMFPEANVENWGEPFNYCEGYRVGFENDNFVNLEFLREKL